MPPPAMPMFPEQELDDGHGADVLRAHGVLRPAHGIELGPDAVRFAG